MKTKTIIYCLLLCLMLLSFSCKVTKPKIIESELTFKSVSFMSFYGATDEQYEKLTKEIDSILNKTNVHEETAKLYKHYERLKKYDLLRKPYIFLETLDDSLITVFVSEKEYNKVKDISRIDLLKENKKIVLELEIKKKDSNIYYSDKIIKVTKVDGQTKSDFKPLIKE